MKEPPRDPKASILGDGLWRQALWVGLLMTVITLAVQAWSYHGGASEETWRTMVFTVLALLQLSNALSARSERDSVFKLGLATNRPLLVVIIVSAIVQLALVYVPFLQPIFETTALSATELLVVALVTPIPFVAVEIEKWVRRRREPDVEAAEPGPAQAA
jgi:Ca2+-transporting ATPase